MLYDAAKRWAANVRADGTLAIGDRAGSIHRLGAEVQGLDACNGWTFWHYERNGGLTQIDELGASCASAWSAPAHRTADQRLQFQVRRSSSHGAIPRRSRSASSVLAFCEQHRLPAGRLGAVDILLAVVDEQRRGRLEAERRGMVIVDRALAA